MRNFNKLYCVFCVGMLTYKKKIYVKFSFEINSFVWRSYICIKTKSGNVKSN